jgi:hypothetical protein
VIVFDLKCDPRGHVFEAWFGSTEDFDGQRARGLVQCPLCGSLEVDKAVMAPRLSTGPAETANPPRAPADPGEAKEVLAAMAAMQKEMLANSDYVGDRFADEARAIYLGESDARSIYGKASAQETRLLRDEGIKVAQLPFPVLLPGEEN